MTKNFKSNDLALSAKNLRKDRNNPTTILDDIDIPMFTKRLMNLLEIKNKDKISINIDEAHIKEIKEYLEALDLIQEIEIWDINSSEIQKQVVFTQPGLRYSQAKSFIDSLSMDQVFNTLSFDERKWVIERVLNEIKGRMMEDIVLLETQIANQNKKVFKLQFADGEFDMVIFDYINGEVELYEIKHTKEINEIQVKHLNDEKKCKLAEFRFGKIKKKVVLYRGDKKNCFGVSYQNVEEYLNSLIS